MSDLEKYKGHIDEDTEIVEASFTIDGEEMGEVEEVEAIPEDLEDEMDKYASGKKPFRIKPMRLALLCVLLLGMYGGQLSPWLGWGIIILYFGIKFAIRHFFQRLLTMPFAMKGKVLQGATAEVHGYTWTDKPINDEYIDDDEGLSLRYAWVDVTITPKELTEESQGFTHWEPGELMICPRWHKIRKVSDIDVCLQVEDVKFLEGEGIVGDDDKCLGKQRVKLLIGIPEGQTEFNFVYYMEVFGEFLL